MQGKERPYKMEARPGVVAFIKSPTERQKRALLRLIPRTRAGEMDTESIDTTWMEAAVREYVARLEPVQTHRGSTFSTGAEIAEYAPDEVLVELANEILIETSLTEGEKKPSGESSDSSGPGSSTGGGGTAGNAGAQAARSIEAAG